MQKQTIQQELELLKFYSKFYRVNHDGTIERTARGQGTMACNSKPKVLKMDTSQHGHKRVTLCIDGKTWRKGVHRLVALTYLPLVDGKEIVNHKDGNPANNDVSNLEWCDYSENLQHAYNVLNRDKMFGEKRTWSVLTDDDVIHLRTIKNPDYHKLADKYNCNYNTIRDAIKGRHFSHLPI
ncbi:putative HNH family endonuclease, phage associated protein [Salmonella enterica subsp. enterica serovar Paratyphi B str. SARA62]|nr:HNH endonuclease [Salmonella enterica]ESE73110.1 putative HNH family endonuclease, phage associated protein [Salmonella enterica subsp. enterica serovar Paratyphi B str. SARA62]ESF86668.1 putative HNH-family endonuclease, phage associated protein [Salmonella enterica subsp. enterica serovar Paratyphi B str. ATCC BAA-1585]QUZ43916.1 HNH endonuclease [Salmonella enterica subsp. enterica serovar Paratyphi B str. CFSAN000549]